MRAHSNSHDGPPASGPIAAATARFEAAWQAALAGAARPRIEELLGTVPEPEQTRLLRELVLLDLSYRVRVGEPVRLQDYLARFPTLTASWIEVQARPYQPTADAGPDQAAVTPIELAGTIHFRGPGEVSSSADEPSSQPRLLGRYEVREEIARGGMGAVLRVHDPALNRDLAVKVLRPDLRDRPDLVERFVTEAQITAQMPHPAIVPVVELGHDDNGLPFLAMKLVRGQTLAALLEGRTTPQQDLPRFVGIFEQVCQAVAFAHSRHVIHRDLKPENVMVGRFGEVQVMDWGLAKVRSTEERPVPTEATSEVSEVATLRKGGEGPRTQGALGTWRYMPPEQANGEQVDERADVFSLGGILGDLLTGQPPYVGRDGEVKRKALRGEVAEAFARLDDSGADLELVALAKECLSPEVEKRPRDASEVARRVALYQAEVQERLRQAERERAAAEARAEEAKATARAEQATAKAERRARQRTVALAAAVLLLVAGGGGAAWWYQHEQVQQEKEQAARLAETERSVTAAVSEARALLDQRPEQESDPYRWQATVGVARSAVRRAKDALATGVVTEELTNRVAVLEREVEDEVSDCDLRLELDKVRLEMAVTRDGHYDVARGVARYRAALSAYGIHVEDTAGAARRVRSSRVREPVLVALTDWLRTTTNREEADRVLAVLEAAEPAADSFHVQWRTAGMRRDGARLAELSRRKEVQALPATALVLLGQDLASLQERPAAEEVLRGAQVRFPDDFWINHDLGLLLGRGAPPRPEEGAPYLLVAVALRSKSGGAHCNLGVVLYDKGDLEGAIRSLSKAIELSPHYALAHNNLGVALRAKGDTEGAIRSFSKAIELDPKLAGAHYNLGNVLYAKGDVEGAIRCCTRAIELDPLDSKAHYNLGNALRAKGDMEGAIRSCTKAIELSPKDAKAHYNLGNAFLAKGDVAGAIRCCTKAIEFDPKDPKAHYNLGNAFLAKGDAAAAIRCYTKAIELDPKDARARYNLGIVLAGKGDTEGAIRCFNIAIELDPKFAQAHGALGQAHLARGDFAQARETTLRLLQLLPVSSPFRPMSSQQLQQCEMCLEMDRKLSTVLKGDVRPKTTAEVLQLAQFCQQYKRFHAAATRFYADAFAAEPKAAEDIQARHRYNAACSAAVAGCGQSKDADKLDAKERARLRKQARDWLRADLDAWGKQVESGKPEQRAAVLETLVHWQHDVDLAGVRDDKQLQSLPADERDGWRQLWEDVAALTHKAKASR